MFINDNTVKECECGLVQKRIHANKLRFASIPETYKTTSLKDMRLDCYTTKDNKSTFKACAEFIKWYLENLDENERNGKGIYLWSETKGSGKTMLVSALANELMNKHKRYAKFSTSLDILDEIRASYDNKGDSESRLLKDLVDIEYLIIDDFGTERVTDWVGEKFYQIINKRYINKKVTFFTSNSDLLTLKYDDRVTNRIRERSYIVHFPEQSVREFKAATENNFNDIIKHNYDFKQLEKEAYGV